MFKAAENLGYRIVSRFLPTVTASAGTCACTPYDGWCKDKLRSTYCTCGADCKTITCRCNPAGCGN
ncbi:hypothetical protein [Micromonospora coxensis]|uniref:Uncharacterized protein n=1 Tax=Micromonospora coxensis TaxID=356852 RepID=A0A1C5I881_9ACTN|nr:hypothetical protein [Micromonospora coxensis]SCG54578.1 hypothetical protein GA0070614_2399 [Micromonospora coxensis]